jgi:hypothetical protein
MTTFKYSDGIFEGIKLTGSGAEEVADYFGVEYGFDECEVKATIERKCDKSVAQWCILVGDFLSHEDLTDDEFCEAVKRFDK